MNLSFENKVALVTGAGSGMGLATAKAFAEAGAAVVLADIDEHAVRSAAEELVSVGQKALAVCCNVADEAEVAALIELTVRKRRGNRPDRCGCQLRQPRANDTETHHAPNCSLR